MIYIFKGTHWLNLRRLVEVAQQGYDKGDYFSYEDYNVDIVFFPENGRNIDQLLKYLKEYNGYIITCSEMVIEAALFLHKHEGKDVRLYYKGRNIELDKDDHFAEYDKLKFDDEYSTSTLDIYESLDSFLKRSISTTEDVDI